MSWTFVKRLSITNRLLAIFISAILLILTLITLLVYPPMHSLLHHAKMNHEAYSSWLTQVCINKLFIGIWLSALIMIIVSYWLAKKSMRPIEEFSKELTMINARTLDKRLPVAQYPRELQELAATCNEMLLRIEKGVSHIKQFSTAMAHELRNPLHYLRNAAEITLTKPQSIEGYQLFIQNQLDEYHHLTQLIDNLLFLARSERRQLQLKPQEISAKSLIQSVIEYYLPAAEEKKISISLEGDSLIYVDPQLFKRVIANLLDNSLAYTNAGGTITLHIEQTTKTQVQIRVEDNGIGIDADHLPFLTQGFYRVNPQNNEGNAGLGLGLAIAQSILENHRAELKIASQLGLGTCVILNLLIQQK
ncbi:MAG: HAMP domain-containing protein [Legionella sp.]|nr:MAG: HAMP domain-containing protein [Legionella sp.]